MHAGIKVAVHLLVLLAILELKLNAGAGSMANLKFIMQQVFKLHTSLRARFQEEAVYGVQQDIIHLQYQ